MEMALTYVHSEIVSTLGRDNPDNVLSLDGDVPLVVRIYPEGRMVSRQAFGFEDPTLDSPDLNTFSR